MANQTDEVITILLDGYGRTYADEIGIDVARDTPGPLFQLLVASLLMSARISARIAVDAARTLLDRGWTTPDKLAATSWQDRVDALDEAKYTRYDESTSSMLGDTTGHLLNRYGGDLRALREEAGREPSRERALLKEFKGLGDVGVDIFFREIQVAWDELFPFADDRVLEAARRLDLASSTDELAGLVGDADFPRLVAALTRVQVSGDYDAVREGRRGGGDGGADVEGRTKAELYEEAQRRDVPGRSKMSKQELAEALSED